jgi:alanyl-tRNA synthetase
MKALDSYSQVKAHIENLKTDPKNSYSQSVMQRMFVKSVNSGAMSIADEALGDNASGIPGLQKKLANMMSDTKVRLSDQETAALARSWEASMQGKLQRQLAVESKYAESGKNYPNIQQDAVRYPSKDYYKFIDTFKSNNENSAVVSKLPKEMQAQAQDALEKAGSDHVKREQVMQKIQGFLQKAGGQQQNAAPQQGAPVNGQ